MWPYLVCSTERIELLCGSSVQLPGIIPLLLDISSGYQGLLKLLLHLLQLLCCLRQLLLLCCSLLLVLQQCSIILVLLVCHGVIQPTKWHRTIVISRTARLPDPTCSGWMAWDKNSP